MGKTPIKLFEHLVKLAGQENAAHTAGARRFSRAARRCPKVISRTASTGSCPVRQPRRCAPDQPVTRWKFIAVIAPTKEHSSIMCTVQVNGLTAGLTPGTVDSALDVVYGFAPNDGHKALFRIALDGSGRQSLVFAKPDVDIDGLVTIGQQSAWLAHPSPPNWRAPFPPCCFGQGATIIQPPIFCSIAATTISAHCPSVPMAGWPRATNGRSTGRHNFLQNMAMRCCGPIFAAQPAMAMPGSRITVSNPGESR